MKTKYHIVALIILSLVIQLGCSKNESVKTIPNEEDTTVIISKLVKTTYSGCFRNQSPVELKSTDIRDTMYYDLSDDILLVHTIVFRNCNSLPEDSVVINYSNVSIYVKDSKDPTAWCDCQFGFNYSFTDFSGLHKVYLYYDEYYGTKDYILWDSLTFN
jgi:hypothetical protein